MKEAKTLIMGIGNLLLGDEGVGVHAARALSRVQLPEWVEVLDVGTAFLDALPALENAERIIVMDAMKAQGKPGTVYRVPLDQCERRECLDSLHNFDIFRMLAIAQNNDPVSAIVFGVVACVLYLRLRNLIPLIVAHFVIDVVNFW